LASHVEPADRLSRYMTSEFWTKRSFQFPTIRTKNGGQEHLSSSRAKSL